MLEVCKEQGLVSHVSNCLSPCWKYVKNRAPHAYISLPMMLYSTPELTQSKTRRKFKAYLNSLQAWANHQHGSKIF